jgi:hypothetical protein
MCGIVGIIVKGDNGLTLKQEDSFYQMLYADAVRGYDSTGVIAVEKDGTFHIAKEAVEATFFCPQVKAHEIGRAMYNRGKAFIGHNRKKTVGEIKDETAHPFVIDNTFALVHNGTLYNHKQLANTDIDSEALGVVLKTALETGKKEDLEKTLGDVYGAYATVMYNQKSDEVYFLRNKDRPLCLIDTPDALYFASEGMMASWILVRNGYEYDKFKITNLEPHTLITYNLRTNMKKEEVLVPKKSWPDTKTPHGSKTTISGSGKNTSGVPITSGMVKWFKRKWLGKKISFWVDDYVEKNYPRTIEEGETELLMFARSEDIPQTHSLNMEVNLAKSGLMVNGDESVLFDTRWTGDIDRIEVSDAVEMAVIYLENVKPVISSKNSILLDHKGNKDSFRKSLISKSAEVLRNELVVWRTHLADWQVEMYETAIKNRDMLQDILATGYKVGYDACFEEADKEGVKLEETREDNVVKLIHPTKGIIYESPITVH